MKFLYKNAKATAARAAPQDPATTLAPAFEELEDLAVEDVEEEAAAVEAELFVEVIEPDPVLEAPPEVVPVSEAIEPEAVSETEAESPVTSATPSSDSILVYHGNSVANSLNESTSNAEFCNKVV